MPKIGDSHTDVHLGMEGGPEPVERDPERPFRILLIGNFSGRAPDEAPRSIAPIAIDRDNFDEVLEDLGVTLDLNGIALPIRELEDFHPDRIYPRVPLFQQLDRVAAASAPPRSTPSAADLLEQIVSENEPSKPVTVEDANDLAAFIRRVSAGHTVAKPTAAERQTEAQRQALAGELMRSILRHPTMQSIEAAWRAAFLLVRGLDTDGDLKIFLLDLTLPELVKNLDAVQKELRKKGAWGVIAGNYAFGQSDTDVQVLARMAGLARSLHAPFVAEGRLGDSQDASWELLRKSERAPWIGLLMPRFLLRLPYGKDTSAIESFPFEEMTGSEHAGYLWGNPAFLCAFLMGQSFLKHAWDLRRQLARRVDHLPQHVYREDGEPVAKPCAEILMTERTAESLLDSGFMPLASMKNEPAALIVRYQSIAQPAAMLAGLE
jgi:type VI secretion system protein ImpC